MDVELTLKNYRCFPETSPARITLRQGLTALIGGNNSGKSSLFRFLFEFRSLFQALSAPATDAEAALTGNELTLSLQGTSDPTEVFSNQNQGDLEIRLDFKKAFGDDKSSSVPPVEAMIITVPRNTKNWRARALSPLTVHEPQESFRLVEGLLTRKDGTKLADLSPLFDACKVLASAIYIGPFRNAITVQESESYFDIHVGQQFVGRWRSSQAGNVKRQNESIDRLTEDIRRIFHFGRLQILPSEDGRTLQLLMDGKSFKLPEVGSGMAQFIVVLANAAISEPSFVLIDEPELNLHPALQPVLLDTLYGYTTHGVIFSTHSIGLARATADRIYAFRQVAEGESQVAEFEDSPGFLSEFLGELSFSAYQELGFEKLLLVEGRHDMNTFRQFLRLLKKEHRVLPLSLGGAEFINGRCRNELEELKRICSNIVAVVDSERSAEQAPLPPDRQAFAELCEEIGIPCTVLDRRATENYLSDRAIKAVKGEKYSALGLYDVLKDASPSWGKGENWRIAREMTLKELEGTDLGQLLKSL